MVKLISNDLIKLVFFVPTTHADVVRKAMGDAGAGLLGKYSHCTFSSKGFGRYKPLDGAHPAIGEVGKFEIVEEERIETMCPNDKVNAVVAAVRKVHPYEEFTFDIIPLLKVEGLKPQ